MIFDKRILLIKRNCVIFKKSKDNILTKTFHSGNVFKDVETFSVISWRHFDNR